MQIEPKKHAGFNRDATEVQKCRKKLKNADVDDDDDDDDADDDDDDDDGLLCMPLLGSGSLLIFYSISGPRQHHS